MVSMETRMTFPPFSGEGMTFTTIRLLALKFCKIPPQDDSFLCKKPVVQSVGGSEPLLTLPCSIAFLSRTENPVFQVDFMRKEGCQHPVLTLNPSPKHPGMERGCIGEASSGVVRLWGKEMLGEGNEMKYLSSRADMVWGHWC